MLKRVGSALLSAALVLGMIVTDLPMGTGITVKAAEDTTLAEAAQEDGQPDGALGLSEQGGYEETSSAAEERVINSQDSDNGIMLLALEDQLEEMAVGGQPFVYDFAGKGDVLGTPYSDVGTTIYSENNYIGLQSTGQMSYNGGQHGLQITSGKTTFAMIVPRNSQGQFTLSVCAYNNEATATMLIDTVSQGAGENIKGDNSNDNGQVVFTHRNTTANPVIMEIEIDGGQCYIHNISYAVSAIPQEATVTGKVGTQVAGDDLVFADENNTKTRCTIDSSGNYSVNLAIGKKYTVTLENDTNGWKLVNATLDLTSATAGGTVTQNFDSALVCWSTSKSFTVTIGGTTFTVTPGATENDNFIVQKTGGDGSVELATPTTALIWANLGGGGIGTLSPDKVSSSNNVTTSISGNTLNVTYTDQTTLPSSYSLQVKDNSATGTPYATGEVLTYDFKNGSVISSLYTSASRLRNNSVSSTDRLVTLTGKTHGIYYNGDHGIVIGSDDTIQIKVAGNAHIDFNICVHSAGDATITASSGTGTGINTEPQIFKDTVNTCANKVSYDYEGEATTLTFTIGGSGSSYLHDITVMNEAEATSTNPGNASQTPSAGLVGNASNLTVTPAGQSLNLVQTGGSIGSDFGGTGNSFYLFPETEKYNVLELDVVVNSCASGNENGIWVGAFNREQYMMTIAARAGTTLSQYYSKANDNGTSGSFAGGTVPNGTTMHYKMYKNSGDSKFYIEVSYDENGETVTATASFNSNSSSYKLLENGITTPVFYGIAVSNANVTVTNLKYTSADGNTVYFDQNTYYNPIGVAPTPTGISAVAAESREYIDVTWTGDRCVGDGKYVLEVSRDGQNWTVAAKNLTTLSYQYPVSSDEGGTYYFRVAGVLGMNVLPTAGYVTMTSPVTIVAALERPVISLSTGASSVTLTWDVVPVATSYQIHRYSFDEGESNAKVIDTVTTTSYTDTAIEEEMPYYYYVTAHTADNWSNPSNTEWAVVTSGRSGEYVYEDESAGITITKKSYDTVFTDKITIEGVIEKPGTVSLMVNGAEATSQTVGARETFSFQNITIAEGRNDVNLIVTDANGNKTRQTFNFVYLTYYDIVVDAAYTGNDGDPVNGIPTYKTVQAAVDAASGSGRVVIFVKEGSYFEHLQVSKPNITLIGEDSEKTVIHFYDAVQSPIGGDMSTRCAIYVKSSATNFSAENLTFENDYAYKGDGTISNESADALRNDAENAVYVNVRLLGYQDTLCANAGKQYYYKCYILGNVDFIYGNEPRAYFNDCQLVFRSAPAKNSGYVAAPRTSADADYGLTFYNCQILSEKGCSGSGYQLARPWGVGAYVTWINCYMGKILSPNAAAPYASMSGVGPEKGRFYEFGSYGPGFAINVNRRQISPRRAEDMRSSDWLGWNPEAETSSIGGLYIGSIQTDIPPKFVENEYAPDTYLETDGDDTNLGKYKLEGYAQSAGVTGGGLLYETSENYYSVASAEEFLQALVTVKKSGMPSVIELTADINLGPNEVANYENYSSVISAHKHQPLIHPTLLQTGMSSLSIRDMGNLTIYSSNGSSIKHACIDIYNSTNIIIRNIAFDECWEWDEYTSGDYDENDWDYMTIEKGSADIWIDHCTFYKAYDGVIDAKTPVASSNITISWCEFLPGSEGNVFFDVMMNELKANAEARNYTYYLSLLNSGMSEEQIYGYAYGQKKTHLFGQADDAYDAVNLTVTLANNNYYNSMDRMPRLRFGTAHVYNCVLNAQELRDIRKTITDEAEARKIVSNGASSTCGGHVLLENSVISGITNALNSGNGSSPAGYINAVNTLYYMDGVRYALEPKVNTTYEGATVLIQDPEAFVSALPYSDYVLYDPATLSTEVVPFTGAGKLTLTALQWEKTAYYDAQWEPPAEIPDYDDEELPEYDADNDVANGPNDSDENTSGGDSSEDEDEDDEDEAAHERELMEEAKEGKSESLVKDSSGKTQRRLTNSKTPGISIQGSTEAIPKGAYFTSEYQTSGKHYKSAATAVQNYLIEYGDFRVIDINLYNANDVAIHQLGEVVSVTIRIPAGLTVANGNVIVVYRLNDDGSLTKCNTTVSGSYITFQTNHFSTFIITEQSKAGAAAFVNRSKAPGTGEKASVAIATAMVLLLAGLAVLEVYIRRRRMGVEN